MASEVSSRADTLRLYPLASSRIGPRESRAEFSSVVTKKSDRMQPEPKKILPKWPCSLLLFGTFDNSRHHGKGQWGRSEFAKRDKCGRQWYNLPFPIPPSLLLFLSAAAPMDRGSTFPSVIFKLQQRASKINTERSAEGPHFLFPGYQVKLASWWPGLGDLFWSEVNPQINNIGKNSTGGENILDKAAYVCRYIHPPLCSGQG